MSAAMLRALLSRPATVTRNNAQRSFVQSNWEAAVGRTAHATRRMHQQATWLSPTPPPQSAASSSSSSSVPTVHIVKLLSRAGVASRRDALRLVQSGRVLVDGAALTAKNASYLIPQTARVTIDGKPFLDPMAAAAQAAEQSAAAAAAKEQGETDAVSATFDAADPAASAGGPVRASSAPAAATAPVTPVRVPTRLPRPRVWLYYKPVGLLCSHKDKERQRRTMFEQIHDDYFAAKDKLRNEASADMQDETIDRLLSVGRLDYLSEGLMILTNSGAIQGFLEHPSTAFARSYRIKIPAELTSEQEQALARGLNIDGFQYKPVQLVRLTAPSAAALSAKRSTGVWYELQLREGKNRELRNLLNHFGHPILKLIRVGFYNWKIDVTFMRQAAAEAAEAARLPPSSPRAIAASMPLAERPPVEVTQRLAADGSGRKKDTIVSLVPGQLVEIEWPSHLEALRKAWLARTNDARAHAAAVAALAPSSVASSSVAVAAAHSSFSRPMHSGSALASPLGSPSSWGSLSPAASLGQSLRSFSSQHTPFSLKNPASAFLSRKKGQHEGHDQPKSSAASPNVSASAPSAAAAAAATVTEEIPSHIHSMTCGCANDNTIPNDDQRILPDEFEGGSEAFLAELDQSITALNSVNDSLEQAGDSHFAASPAAASGASAHIASSSNPSAKWNLASLLHHNHLWVQRKSYVPYLTDRFPYKRLVVVTCMDTRLTELLPQALDLKNGDAKIIKVAGAMVAHPFGSVMRSILVAVYALGAQHILVVGHHDCGMTGLDTRKILHQAQQRGIPESTFKTLAAAGLNLESWLSGFASVESSVLHSVDTIRNHPLLNFQETSVKASEAESMLALTGGAGANNENAAPSIADTPSAAAVAAGSVARTRIPKITVTGLVICPTTGKLDLLTPPDDDTKALLERLEKEKEKERAQDAARGTAAAAKPSQPEHPELSAVNCS